MMSALRALARWTAPVVCGLLLGGPLHAPAWAAAGSWVGDAASVRLFTPGRMETSEALMPPALATGATIRTFRWRFTLPTGQPHPAAWLCHPRRCIALSSARGRSRALAGLAADVPLTFRFRLPPGARPSAPLRVEGLQVIVDYR